METLKNYVNWKLAHSDKTAIAEGYPLVMENCKTNKKMKQLEVYGDCFQRLGSKNLLPYPYYKTTATINGVTFTDNGDGSITVNGTATADAVFYLYTNNTTLIPGIKRGDTVTGTLYSDKEWDASVEKLMVVLNYHNSAATMKAGVILNSSLRARTFAITDDWYGMGFYMLVSKGGVVDNITLRVQIELGTTSTEYEPYVLSPSPDCPSEIETVGDLTTDNESEYYGKYKIPITLRGKNLFDKDHALVFNGYFSGTTIANYYPTPSGMATLCINCKPNTTYTASRQILSARFAIASSPNPPAAGTAMSVAKANHTGTSVTITTTALDKYLYIWFYNKSVDPDYTYQELMNGIQIENGSIATEYEPYSEPITQNIYLDEPLRKVGDYADYIDFKNKRVIRNVKEITFETKTFNEYSYGTTLDNTYHFNIRNMGCIYRTSMFCNIMKAGSINMNSDANDTFFTSMYSNVANGGIYLQIEKALIDDYSGESNVEKLKLFLLEKQAKLLYCVSEYTEEDISCQLPKTIAKTTVIEVDTTLLPSNIKGKYIIK